MKKNNLHYFVDGHSYSEEKVPECIREYFIKSNNNYKLQAVGLIIERNTSYIFLPHNTSLCDELTNTDIQNLVQVMIIVNNLFYNSNGDRLIDKQLSDKYSVIKWLIEDYHNFGIYSPTSRISCKKDKGIINWNKSIKKIRPVFINNEAYILDFFRTKKIQTEDIVSDIQRVVLSEISDNFGGIFNDFKYRLHNDELRFLKEDREYLKRDYREHLINILRCRLSTINAMRERTLVKNLITYLGLGDVDNLTVVTKEFHVIFEKIMKVALEDKEDLHKYVPTAQWDFTINGHEYSPHNNQIPDALVEKNNSLYIYDAKYYDLNPFITGKAKNKRQPLDWYSVGKQFFYWMSFPKRDIQLEDGENAFVFPYHPINGNVLTEEIGSVFINVNGKEETIKVLLMDPFIVMDTFLRNYN